MELMKRRQILKIYKEISCNLNSWDWMACCKNQSNL